MTSERELAHEILMFTSEASTLGSNGRHPEEAKQGLNRWKEDGNSWPGKGRRGEEHRARLILWRRPSRGWDTVDSGPPLKDCNQ